MLRSLWRAQASISSHADRHGLRFCSRATVLASSTDGEDGAQGASHGSSEPKDAPPSPSPHEPGMQTLRIDRSGLVRPAEPLPAAAKASKEPETEMAAHIKALVQFRGGPITVAEYMKEVLTNPISGFYMTDVIGSKGDFITSPEISQMFGELIGIYRWGRRTPSAWWSLARARGPSWQTSKSAPSFQPSVEVHLVEVGTEMRKLQWTSLGCGEPGSAMEEGATEGTSSINRAAVKWHRSLDEVPSDGPTIYIAHEFLDALPVHQFQKSDRGWVERLVDEASDDSPLHLRFVLSPTETPATRLLLERRLRFLGAAATQHQELEISAMVMNLASGLATRVGREGGAALLIDYGQDAPYGTSLQGIREHRQVPVLESPGKVDLSAWVDFSAVRQAVAEESEAGSVATHGPVTQSHFLHSLGIQARLESLLQVANEQQKESLQQGYLRLVGSAGDGGLEDGMGQTYKAMVIASTAMGVPVAFDNLDQAGAGSDQPGDRKN
eukprot:CAMPEP_0117682992 /NCGR_PEP_ID=MMETSP0804-20121206/20064_1 /TAXON_ID=1074897 /ORGANISM="Tetraselmis astigmatica, Strain CCMP880" /LENGTH=496 /DNA_ID=CAMNT_0005493359 /DNA_START=181 /DNA_END=1672 /DNA_ORIENTATION=+